MSSNARLPLPPVLLKRVEHRDPVDLNAVENVEISRDLSLDQAKALSGQIVSEVLKATDAPAKAYGDKGAVSRWRAGAENPNLAKLIQTAEARKAMAKVLLRSCGECVRERTVFEIEESA